jgi:hypothetical protein
MLRAFANPVRMINLQSKGFVEGILDRVCGAFDHRNTKTLSGKFHLDIFSQPHQLQGMAASEFLPILGSPGAAQQLRRGSYHIDLRSAVSPYKDRGDLPPDEFIQPYIPDDQQPLLACPIKKVLYSFNIHLMMRALLAGLRLFAKAKLPMLSRLLFPVLCAAAVDEVVVPVPSEIFNVLDKLGSPNWKAEMRDNLGKNTGNRAQVALLLGTVIADGFIAVEAENSESVKQIGQEVLNLADAINVRKAVIARSKSIIDKADAKNWRAVREELDGALQDVRGAMVELGDDDLAQLVSIGGWIRGTEVLTSIVGKNYSAGGAELLNQPELLNYFSRRIDEMRNSRLKKEELVARVRKLLREIRSLIGKSGIPQASVEKINKMTNEIVVVITSDPLIPSWRPDGHQRQREVS